MISPPFFMFKQENKSIIFTLSEKIEHESYTQKNINLRDTTAPTPHKQYTAACKRDCVIFSDFNIKPEFSDCADGFVITDMEKLKAKKRKRYMRQ